MTYWSVCAAYYLAQSVQNPNSYHVWTTQKLHTCEPEGGQGQRETGLAPGAKAPAARISGVCWAEVR